MIEELPAELEITEHRVAVAVVYGDRVSTAVIERAATAGRSAEHVPIGTRDAASLTMLLDDVAVTLRPGPGRYMRGSYKVVVRHGDVTYRFRPKSPEVSRLLRDGVRLGDFEVRRDGGIDVTWHEEAAPTAEDAAVGHALAAAFGTGAQFFIMMLFDLLGHGPD